MDNGTCRENLKYVCQRDGFWDAFAGRVFTREYCFVPDYPSMKLVTCPRQCKDARRSSASRYTLDVKSTSSTSGRLRTPLDQHLSHRTLLTQPYQLTYRL